MKKLLFFVLTFFSLTLFCQTSIKDKDAYIGVKGTSSVHDWNVVLKVSEIEIYQFNLKKDTLRKLELRIPVASLEASRKSMQKKIAKALKGNDFPFLTVTLDGIRLKNDSLYATEALFTIAGKQRKLPFKCEYRLIEGKGLFLSGIQKIGMANFEVQPPSAMFGWMKVGNEVLVNYGFFIPLKKEENQKIK
ncbi:MAG: hypothetical protein COB60_10215 [Flavobacteriaceae bacterium]|nr:MAG: hypothetical protein COB60_10215 [Flavobacteriaceae bacterium]